MPFSPVQLKALQALGVTQYTPVDDYGRDPEETVQSAAAPAPTPPVGLVQHGDNVNGPSMDVIPVGQGGKVPVPDMAEGQASTGTAREQTEGALGEMGLDAYLLGRTPGGVAKPTIEAGENYAAVGGKRGKERFEQATDTAPAMATEAIQEGAENQDQEGKELARFYKNEQDRASNMQANIVQRRQEDIFGEQQRQKEIEDRTRTYSQNLADRGAFWKNPGNIIAAIGFALMPFASEDKAIGIKLLDNAIQSDFNTRKTLADRELGELRSNLTGYRQIAQNRQSGDLLAQAEAYRIAAMEVQRIAASYQGPKAIAASKAMIAELTQKSNMLAMQAYRSNVYVPPQAMTPQMQQAYRDLPGYQSFNKGAPQQKPQGRYVYDQNGNIVDYEVSPATSGRPAQASSGGVQQPQAPPGKYSALLDTKDINAPKQSAEEQTLSLLDKRSPGLGSIAKNFKENLRLWAESEVQNPEAHPEAVKVKMAEHLKSIKEQTDKISAANASKENAMAGSAMFQKDIRDLEAAFHGNTANINKFLGYLKGYPYETEIDNFLTKTGLGNEEKQRARQAAMRFSQVMNANMNAYYRETSGGAVTPMEQERLNKVISQNSPFEQIRGFANDMSRRHSAELRNVGAGQNSLALQYYLVRLGQRFPELNSPGTKER